MRPATMSMTEQAIKSTVLDVLANIAPDVEIDLLDRRRNFRDQVALDSMDFLSLVIGLQEKLGIEISELDFPRLSSLDGCMNYLCARLDVTRTGTIA